MSEIWASDEYLREELKRTQRLAQSGWKEAAIAWEVCASIHETWAKKERRLVLDTTL